MKRTQTFFNLVSDFRYYPENWNLQIGSKYEPYNHRRITRTSCLGELFSSLLHFKIEKKVEKKITLPLPSRLQKKL